MRSRIITLLAIVLTTACGELNDPASITGVDGLSGVKTTKPLPAMTMSCLQQTRAAVMTLLFDGVLTEAEVNPLLNRLDVVIRQVERDHERPASNVADSYNYEVQKYVESGRLTAEQASTIMMSFECIAPVAIAAGESHNCVLLSDNSVWCWGSNSNGQLGIGSTSNSSVPVRVAGLSAQKLEAGGFNTCVLTSGQPWCWGRNEWGQLGNGSMAANSTTPIAVSWPISDAVEQLSVGWALACARVANGETYCWGQNSSGGVGSPATTDMCSGQFCARTPVRISTTRTYTDVDVGIQGGCAIGSDGLAYCWGSRSFGALGDGVQVARCTIAGVLRSQCASEPTLVAGDNHFKKIQFGAQYVCAIRADDQAMCWGSNDGGELGVGSLQPGNAFSPLSVVGEQTFASLSAVDGIELTAHVCGLNAAGDALCWGWNKDGQLGAANKDCAFNGVASPCATSPQAVSGLKFKQVAVGRGHSCGITADNRVLCWGANAMGQLGDGSTSPHGAPAPVVASWSDTP
ncbi:MAG TPA: hypothetical protein VFT29_01365 [Gemmatimonadaceae bacterium]|nr:hypothetical protein [Gemmatimonadaceae bacterium]